MLRNHLETWAAAIVDAMILEGGGRRGAKAAAAKHNVSEKTVWNWKRKLKSDEGLAALCSLKLQGLQGAATAPLEVLQKPVIPSVSEVLERARHGLSETAQLLQQTAENLRIQLSQGQMPSAERLEAIARLTDSTTELYQTLAGLDMARENSRQYLEILRQVYTKDPSGKPTLQAEPERAQA
jgi:hypothetical protein